MVAILAWLDHDSQSRERMNEVLDGFEEDGTRDDLGIGRIRDHLSDRLFPGTTTLQTRLRYFLIVPWTYTYLEDRGVAANDVAKVADELQRDMIPILVADDPDGAFGRVMGRSVKQLPDSVYWSGLRRWGIFRLDLSRRQYHRQFERFHSKEDTAWRNLPPRPRRFPDELTLSLTSSEAGYLFDRITDRAQGTLLHEMVDVAHVTDPTGWDHLWDFPSTLEENRRLARQARLFSYLIRGASLLHNLLLADHKLATFPGSSADDLVDQYRRHLADWSEGDEYDDVLRWDPTDLLDETGVGRPTRLFITQWQEHLRNHRQPLADDDGAREHIKYRVLAKKGNRARFRNDARLEQWTGGTGTRRLAYRWRTVSRLLQDIHDAMK